MLKQKIEITLLEPAVLERKDIRPSAKLLFLYLSQYLINNSPVPTLSEIIQALGYKSTKAYVRDYDELIKQGLVDRRYGP